MNQIIITWRMATKRHTTDEGDEPGIDASGNC
jgi:hypothetical protein